MRPLSEHRPSWLSLFLCVLAGLSLLLVSCGRMNVEVGAGHLDFSAKLAGEYYLHRTSADRVSISPREYDLISTPYIPDAVVECNSDGRFIIAKRQGLKRQGSDLALPPGHHDLEHAGDRDPNVFDYWILDTSTPAVFGPMDYTEFKSKRAQLGVAQPLEFKDIEEFRP